MTKSVFVRRLDAIVRSVSPQLKAAGFREKGRAFNRSVEDGLVHVIGFQMGQFPVGNLDTYVVPGLRENLYGKYAVNLGVHIREVYELTSRTSVPAFCQDYHCEIRARLGTFANPSSDKWWPLDRDDSCQEMSSLLSDALESWFPMYAARDQILAIDTTQTSPLGWPPRGAMVQSIMWAHRGDIERASRSMQKYGDEYKVRGTNLGHRDYIREIASRLRVEIDAR